MNATAALMLGSICLLAADDAGEQIAAEFKALEGSWRIVSIEQEGIKHAVGPEKWVFEGNQAKVYYGNNHFLTRRFRLDPAATPKAMDRYTDFGRKGEFSADSNRAIYEIDGDTLRICIALTPAGKRPEDFSSAKGSIRKIYVFKREKR